ncbi:BTAD domain-containing putative transcriptional regulator [Arthrobacter sp. NPDC057009]|uniref:BTAD domain-containing putative transcriptional regulator n=1 Tax=Arthrobacter sp. NPDC057009 TaxID=3345996 RepID=UPI0036434E3E
MADLVSASEDLAEALYFIVDDVHVLANTSAEAELDQLLTLPSPSLHFLLGSRCFPGFNLAKSELQSAVTVSGDDLRFRPIEVDLLFRRVYRKPLTPAGVFNLTEKTDGWAAALHLFHLATTSHSAVERRRAAESINPTSSLERDYFSQHFLAGIPAQMTEFLHRTCFFPVLTPSRCDALLGFVDSRTLLLGLERLGIISTGDNGVTYRVPHPLRQQLVASWADGGARLAADSRQDSAAILEQERAYGLALELLAEGQDWEQLRNLLRRVGASAVQPGGCRWASHLPESLIINEPVAALAASRQLLDDGCIMAASATASRVEQLTTDPQCLKLANEIHLLADVWANDGAYADSGPAASLRAASRCRPSAVAQALSGQPSAPYALARGLALLLAGDQRASLPWLRRTAESLGVEPAAALAAQLVLAVFGPENSTTAADSRTAEVDAVQRQAAHFGLTWLARVARGVQAAFPGTASSQAAVQTVIESCEGRGDEWGAALVAAAAAHLRLHSGRADPAAFEELALRFRRLGAGTLEAWAHSAQALVAASVDLPEAVDRPRAAEAFARAAEVPGALAVAYAAMALQSPENYSDLMQAAIETAKSAGLMCRPWTWLASEASPAFRQGGRRPARIGGPLQNSPDRPIRFHHDRIHAAPVPASVEVRCFGGFRLRLDGWDVDLARVRPQARTVMRILAMNAGRPVHRESLAGILWADLDTASALHNLQVSISSLRRALQLSNPTPCQPSIARHGEAYALVLAGQSTFDLVEFDQAVHDAYSARVEGDHRRMAAELRRAVELYSGEVLPEDGPAEWVIDTRERYRLRAAESAAMLANAELAFGNTAGAARAASRSVEIDPWRDESWRTLVEVLRHSGDLAAAERAHRRYQLVLRTLGVAVDAVSGYGEKDVSAFRAVLPSDGCPHPGRIPRSTS